VIPITFGDISAIKDDEMKNQDRLHKPQTSRKSTLRKLARNPKIRILAASGLASTAIFGGALFSWLGKSPPKPVTASTSSVSNPIKQPVVTKTSTDFTVKFPPSQLPTSFKDLPAPVLISSASFAHKSTLEQISLAKSPRLQKILEDTVKAVTNDKLKKEDLSIAVIDVNHNEIAGYQSDRLEYPASVVKLFWAVALYEQIDHKLWKNTATFDALAKKMIIESDNEAASFIVDSITKAPSLAKNLEGKEWQDWRSKRLSVNQFFNLGGYEKLNVSQKTYPVPYLNLSEPTGTDKTMRQENTTPDKPIRNKVTTEQAAKLMYEVCSVPSLSQESSTKICSWLTRDLKNENWRKAPGIPANDFNPIRGFMGEGVAAKKNITIRSKAGWTKDSRQEVIAIRDGKNSLIIAAFANNSAYANSDKIFAAISNRLYFQSLKK
jgi:beta-lactamase class A